MTKCPKCGVKITELHWIGKIVNCAVFTADGEYDEGGFEESDHENAESGEYSCPKCDELLFTDHDEAYRFLQNAGSKRTAHARGA